MLAHLPEHQPPSKASYYRRAELRGSSPSLNISLFASLLSVLLIQPARSAIGKIANPDVFKLHIALAASVKLQRNLAIRSARMWIRKIHHLYSIQPRAVAIADNLDQIIVPLTLANNTFV